MFMDAGIRRAEMAGMMLVDVDVDLGMREARGHLRA